MPRHPQPLRGFAALLGPERWNALLDAGRLRTFRRGAILLRQGDPGGFLLAVHGGRVAVVGGDEDGGEVLLALRGTGDLVGEVAVGGGNRSATVRAVDPCTVHVIAATAFRSFLIRHDAHGVFTEYLAAKLSETVPYSVRQTHRSPRARLCRLLWDLLQLDEDDDRRIPLSQEMLARALGMARSTVAEHVAALRREGVLSTAPRLTVLDPERLARHAEVESVV
ncbi:Crp/Fnr family transcriptional regulator [Saccharomonospora sp. NB11]|uniref:Crp/Fnr family transcriptional regulator n=1 Tax=Saccharomonospora sp. NB11 TaxID=1642298 RepID=UPI0018D1BDDB|nr:cyclic nucleotide-binding domain-containing protein [Saccharomonospora sp. NB11]